MNLFLLLIALVILVCVLSQRISKRLGIPMLLVFIILGMLFGSEGILSIPFENYTIAQNICSIALIIIMFYGGFGTNWETAKPVSKQAILLSTLGVFLTALFTGLFCFFILHIDLLESLLIGALISSTDAASVFSILRSKKLNLKEGTASLLEIESGSNDPCSYMLTMTFLSLLNQEISGMDIFKMIFLQIVCGIIIGIAVAYIGLYLIKHLDFETEGFDTVLVLSISIFSYTISSLLGGNGYLSTYMTGILLGNQWIPNKKALVHFFDGLTTLAQMLIFFLLGLLAFPSLVIKNLVFAFFIALFLTFIARPVTVFSLLSPFKQGSFQQKCLISFAGLRGAASIVFAIMATTHEAMFQYDLFHIIFGVVLFSIAFQGTLLPYVASKLNMVDEHNNVLKTFNDYSDEADLHLIRIHLNKNHEWIHKQIKDLGLPRQLLVTMILRHQTTIVPTGMTELLEEDTLVLGALAFNEGHENHLTEIRLEKGDPRLHKALKDLPDHTRLIILIKRNGDFFIPDGDTILLEKDILIYH